MKISQTIVMMAVFGIILIGAVIAGASYLAAPALPVTPAGEVVISAPACDPTATGNLAPELRFEIVNPLNTAKENKYDTARVYLVAAGTDATTVTSAADGDYVGTVTTSSSGLIADGSGWECECGATYLITTVADQVAATSSSTGNSTTAITMICEKNDNTIVKSGSIHQPDLSGLRAKVYDNDLRAYCYTNKTGAGGTATGTWLDLSIQNASAYCNSGAGSWETDETVGTDGYLDKTIQVRTNSSTATDSQFNDQSLLIGVDLQSEDDWAEPSTLSFDGENILDDEVDCPTKISNQGIDYCYLVPGNPSLSTSGADLDLYIESLSGVNPDDEVEIHFFTSGWIASTVDNSATISYVKDNPAKDLVYLGNNLTFQIA